MTTGTAEKAQVAPRPYAVGVSDSELDTFDSQVFTLGATVLPATTYRVPACAAVKSIYFDVSAVGVNAAAVVTRTEDGQFAAVRDLRISANEVDLCEGLTLWDVMCIDKYAGYVFNGDPRASEEYSAMTTGAGATGSFRYIVRYPVEFVHRDRLGALKNTSNLTPFQVKYNAAPLTDIYGVAPDTSVTLTVAIYVDTYTAPNPKGDGDGNPVQTEPPAYGTTQFWKRSDEAFGFGSLNITLHNIEGYPLRGLLFWLKGAAGTRAVGEADWPAMFHLKLQNTQLLNRPINLWRKHVSEDYGYAGAASDTVAASRDVGLFPFMKVTDFGNIPGEETRRSYIRSSFGETFSCPNTTWGGAAAHTLYVLRNYIVMGAGLRLSQIAP